MPPFPWPRRDGATTRMPAWAVACTYPPNATAAAAPCVDAFRAALREWFYAASAADLPVFPSIPLSSEPCA